MFNADVAEVQPLDGRRLRLRFTDGLEAVLGIDPELGTVVWPNGADVCPDVLYSYASGRPVVVDGQRVLN